LKNFFGRHGDKQEQRMAVHDPPPRSAGTSTFVSQDPTDKVSYSFFLFFGHD
jgi:hypothetical protein